MPETAMGLFPDVGSSYFLSRLPGFFGNFTSHIVHIYKENYCNWCSSLKFIVKLSATFHCLKFKSLPGHRAPLVEAICLRREMVSSATSLKSKVKKSHKQKIGLLLLQKVFKRLPHMPYGLKQQQLCAFWCIFSYILNFLDIHWSCFPI